MNAWGMSLGVRISDIFFFFFFFADFQYETILQTGHLHQSRLKLDKDPSNLTLNKMPRARWRESSSSHSHHHPSGHQRGVWRKRTKTCNNPRCVAHLSRWKRGTPFPPMASIGSTPTMSCTIFRDEKILNSASSKIWNPKIPITSTRSGQAT